MTTRGATPYAGGVEEATLLYDSDCDFCRWSVTQLLRWDRRGRLRAVPLQAAEADDLLGGMAEETRVASWHLVADGTVYSAGAAAAPLLRRLQGGAPLAMLASKFPGATERAYRWVAEHRNALGRWLGAHACGSEPSEASQRLGAAGAVRASRPRPSRDT